MSSRYLESAYETGMPTVRGPVEFEVNAVLSTSGDLAVNESSITYEPGAAAKLLGRGPLVIPTSEVRGIARRDGNRRLVISTNGDEYVFRGVGAQRAWVTLSVMFDRSTGFHLPPMVFEEDYTHNDEVHGLYGFGARGFGYSGRLSIGLVVSFWEGLDALRSIRTVNGQPVVRGTGEWTLTGRGAETFARALVVRWLESMAVDLVGEAWRTHAAWQTDDVITFGSLAFQPEGLVFLCVDDAVELLAARGRRVAARVDEADASLLRLDTDGEARWFRVLDCASTAAAVTATVVSSSWRTAEDGFDHQAIAEDQLSLLQGPFTSVTLSHGGGVVASVGRTVLRPNAYEVELELELEASRPIPTELPFRCELQVAGARGRYGVQGVVVLVTQRRRPPTDITRVASRVLVLMRFRGEVYPVNRREFFRLGVAGDVHRFEITIETRRRNLTRDLQYLNVSGGGCRIAAGVAPPVGSPCVVEIECANKVVSVSGVVVNVTASDPARWEIGIAYDRESRPSGARIYQDKQTEFLRKRQRS